MTLIQFILINSYLVLFWGIFQLLTRGKRHTTFNRWYLILAPLLSISAAFLPSTGAMTISNPLVVELAQVDILSSAGANNGVRQVSWMVFIYGSGALISLIILVRNLYKVLRKPDAEFLNRSEGIAIYLLTSGKSSYSFFNRIYLDENQLENSSIILLHERAHCKGLHTIDILLYAIYRSLFWFNPIIYLLDKASKENHEFIADQSVLNQSIDPKEYGYSLLSAAFNCAVPTLGNGFNAQSMLLKRIQHLKFKNQINMKHVLIVPAVIVGLVITTTSMTFNPKTTYDRAKIPALSNQDENVIPAEFIGGQEAMMTYLMNNLVYPKTKTAPKDKSLVYVGFTVTEQGEITNVELAKGSEHEEFNAEATRVISQMPNWKPATKDGKPVASKMTLPIMFKLD